MASNEPTMLQPKLHFIIQSQSQLLFVIFLLFLAFNAFIDTPPHSNASLKVKTLEEKGIGVHSLIRNTSKVKWVCWSFGVKTKTNDKQVNYSHGFAQTKQQVGWWIVGAFLVHGRIMGIHKLT